jgi:hypothetical protein
LVFDDNRTNNWFAVAASDIRAVAWRLKQENLLMPQALATLLFSFESIILEGFWLMWIDSQSFNLSFSMMQSGKLILFAHKIL